MKIQSIAVSNIRSFEYDPDFSNRITFNATGLNLIIGPNGAGKSNLIEIMTRIFSSIYAAESTQYGDLKFLIASNKAPTNYNAETGIPSTFTKHRGSADKPSGVRLKVLLDEGDLKNIQAIRQHQTILRKIHDANFEDISRTDYHTRIYEMLDSIPDRPTSYIIELIETASASTSQNAFVEKESNLASAYLRSYRVLCTAIDIHNDLLRPELFRELEKNEPHNVSYQRTIDDFAISSETVPISRLEPPLLLMSVQDRIANINLSYGRLVEPQLQGVSARTRNYERQILQKSAMGGINVNDSESFELLKERICHECMSKISGTATVEQAVSEINNSDPVMRRLNQYLEWFDLKLTLSEFDPWRAFIRLSLTEFSHSADVLDLSSGQRTVLNIASNLTLGAELKSFVLIDEIENHLHPSVQAKLRDALTELSATGVQAIAVTHSPIFINAKTLEATARIYSTPSGSKVRMCADGVLRGNAKSIINVLQYTNGARVFFTNKVLLVEGPSDELFFSAYLEKCFPKSGIEVINTGTKDQIENWKKIISQFDVEVFAISDLDSATKSSQPTISEVKNRSRTRADFAAEVYKVLEDGAARMRERNRYILMEGALESYVPGTADKLQSVHNFLDADDWSKLKHADELEEIVTEIVNS